MLKERGVKYPDLQFCLENKLDIFEVADVAVLSENKLNIEDIWFFETSQHHRLNNDRFK